MVKKIFVLQFIVLFSVFSFGSENKISIKTEVSSTSISIDENIIFKIFIKGKKLPSKITNGNNLLKDFEIISKRSYLREKRDLRLGNYKEKEIVYTLKPKRSGELIIPSFVISHKNTTYKTYPLTIYVSEKEVKEKQLFIKAVLKKQNLYPNEQTMLIFDLFTDMSISGVSLKESLSVSGLWVEEYPDTGIRKAELVKGGANPLYKYRIKRYAIFPRKKGKIIIPSITFEITTSSNQTLYRKSNPITLYVKEIAPEKKPDNFRGLVGNFSLSSAIDKYEITKGAPVKLKIVISGTGNIKALPPPKLRNTKNFKYFPPEVNIKLKYNDKNIIETKEWVYMLVPLKTGIIKTPFYCIWYFVPAKNIFRNNCTRTYKILVKKESGGSEKIIITRKQLPPPEIEKKFLEDWNPSILENPKSLLIIIILLPLLNLFFYLIIILIKRKKLNKNKIKNHKKYIKKQLKKLSKIKDKREFVNNTIRFIEQYIFILYGKENALENFSLLKNFLIEHHFPLSLINELTESIKILRASVYSPKKNIPDKQSFLEKLEKLLIRLGEPEKK